MCITYAPGAEWLQTAILSVWGVVAGVSAVLAVILGRLPPTHAVHQSSTAWAGAVAVAVTTTVVLALVG